MLAREPVPPEAEELLLSGIGDEGCEYAGGPPFVSPPSEEGAGWATLPPAFEGDVFEPDERLWWTEGPWDEVSATTELLGSAAGPRCPRK